MPRQTCEVALAWSQVPAFGVRLSCFINLGGGDSLVLPVNLAWLCLARRLDYWRFTNPRAWPRAFVPPGSARLIPMSLGKHPSILK